MSLIQNPILKGFNPDPSICRVGDDYYIATSTFEWFPGVQIHHSRDLVNWELIGHPLTRKSQLDMYGTPNSTGIWAPCLSYDQGVFYLIYTNVRNLENVKDTPNYLVTTTDIYGEWSEPIYLNSSGFDPSLFHDSDGRKWFINLKWETMYGRNPFGGILLQEYDPIKEKLVGPIKNVFKGSKYGLTEGPHLYKLNGYYYMMVAEGGTSYEHRVTLARSKNIDGPYVCHPNISILTGDTSKMYTTLQKAGHASIVDTPHGDWYMVHLCSRPLIGTDRCNLGRETAIQKVIWKDDDWLYLEGDGQTPFNEVISPYQAINTTSVTEFVDYFDQGNLNINWNTLRIPGSDRLFSLTATEKGIRLYGRESLESTFEQSLIARRQQSFVYEAETKLSFKPETSLHMAGLTAYYNTANYYYLRVSYDDVVGKYCLGVMASQNGDISATMLQDNNVYFETFDSIKLKVNVDHSALQFSYQLENGHYTNIGPKYDASTLSDDFSWLKQHAFTGAFVGICCQDVAYGGHPADFEFFRYSES